MVKAVVFDLDGTLIDSMNPIYNHHMQTAEKLGLKKYPYGEFMSHSGQGWHHILKILWPEIDPEKFIEEYKKFAREIYPAFPGAVELVKSMKEDGMALGIITGKIHSSTEKRLGEAGFDLGWFDFIHGEDDVTFCKPNGKVFDTALTILGLKEIGKENMVYVGDGVNDMLAARDAGIRFIGVLTGYATKEDFDGEEVIESVKDLLEVLK